MFAPSKCVGVIHGVCAADPRKRFLRRDFAREIVCRLNFVGSKDMSQRLGAFLARKGAVRWSSLAPALLSDGQSRLGRARRYSTRLPNQHLADTNKKLTFGMISPALCPSLRSFGVALRYTCGRTSCLTAREQSRCKSAASIILNTQVAHSKAAHRRALHLSISPSAGVFKRCRPRD